MGISAFGIQTRPVSTAVATGMAGKMCKGVLPPCRALMRSSRPRISILNRCRSSARLSTSLCGPFPRTRKMGISGANPVQCGEKYGRPPVEFGASREYSHYVPSDMRNRTARKRRGERAEIQRRIRGRISLHGTVLTAERRYSAPFSPRAGAPYPDIETGWRSGRDSNPRYAFDVYSLSRRAPSTTRPPLRIAGKRRP